MARRHRMNRKKSRRNFRSGTKTHKRNVRSRPMRGGLRI